ncbi:MAG: peptidylprolyl isomerase [Caldilineaceae bacterium]|nr:peptidylprolyl isomerase [Caldilineaceae bacterium]
MAKRDKRKQKEEVARELTRKEVRLRERDRERHRTLYLGVGVAVGLAVIVILAGALYAFAYIPNSTLASVNGDAIVTKDFWQRMRLERSRLINQLVNLQQLEQQFGQSFFTSQINQIQAQLQSPFALGAQVLDQMIEDEIVVQQAAERGITVSQEEVDTALREEIARSRNAVTAPQATETTEAGLNATATATLWTPTPTPTIDASLLVTATATPIPTQEPLPPSVILSDTGYTEGVENLRSTLNDLNSVSIDEYRDIIRTGLLKDKLTEVIANERVSATEEQVHARHILIRVMTPTLEITNTSPITAPIAPTTTLTDVMPSEAITATEALTASETVTGNSAVTETTVPTVTTADAAEEATAESAAATTPVTATGAVTGTEALSGTTAMTGTATVTDTGTVTTAESLTNTQELSLTPPEPVERTDAEARALAEEIRQRLLAGEDFATLAQEYSDDTGSGAQGGDLDWFGRGAMVPPFEEAAFSLDVGEISEPIKSQFGYHIIEVLERDENRPKDESTLEQERTQAFQDWLQEQETAATIERPADLNARLPRDLR